MGWWKKQGRKFEKEKEDRLEREMADEKVKTEEVKADKQKINFNLK